MVEADGDGFEPGRGPVLPGFRPMQICADLQDFFAGFCKDRWTESYRSAESLQKCADFL